MFWRKKDNRNRRNLGIVIILAVIFVMPCVSLAGANAASSHEYRLKAAFMFQFVNFIDGWKFQQKTNENDQSNDKRILIGIIGEDPFKDAFKPLMEKTVKNRKIAIKRFKGLSKLKSQDESVTLHPDLEDIKKCDLIFVCPSERQYIDEILDPLRNERILTISESQGFLEKGGVINFIIEKSRVRFEVNIAGAKRANMTIRSKLLRLAAQIIMDDEVEEA